MRTIFKVAVPITFGHSLQKKNKKIKPWLALYMHYMPDLKRGGLQVISSEKLMVIMSIIYDLKSDAAAKLRKTMKCNL